MAEYLCQIGEPAGELRRRRIEARTPDAAREALEREGFIVFHVRRVPGLAVPWLRLFGGGAARDRTPAAGLESSSWARLRAPAVRSRDVLLFNQELAALLRAGLPLAESLAIMTERMDNRTLRAAVSEVLRDIRSGEPMSRAVRRFSFFPPVYAACLQAGETSGDLPGMLARFTEAFRVAVRARSQLTAALVYPIFLLTALLGTAAFLLLGVVPEFIPFFAGFGQELPALTTVLLSVAEGVRTHLGWVLGGGAALGALGLVWSRRPESGRIRDRLLLRLPGVGEVLRLYAVSQFCRSLGALLAGGMPLANAIPVAAGSVGNRHLRSALEPAAREVSEGRPFVEALGASGEIPGFALQMVRVGEGTGDLARMVSSVSDFNDEVIENRVTVLLSLLTPVVLLLLGGFVALVLLAIYLPLMSLASVPQF